MYHRGSSDSLWCLAQALFRRTERINPPPACLGSFLHSYYVEILSFEPSAVRRPVRPLFPRCPSESDFPYSECRFYNLHFSFSPSDLPCHNISFFVFSDIDVVIQNCAAGEGELKFHLLADQLEADGVVIGRPFIVGGTRVPVMKMIDAESGCLVDISFEGHAGPANTRLVMGFLDAYPLARPLALVVKYYLKQRKLNDTYLGGVGSYTLALLVISFMQRYGSISQSLPVLLAAFFELYGLRFDYFNHVISVVNGGGYLTKEEKGWVNPDFEDSLAVEDPLMPELDVGFASFNMREVKSAFAEAFNIISRGPVHLSVSGTTYHHSIQMSFLRRLINVSSSEMAKRKAIRDAFYAAQKQVVPVGTKQQQHTPAPSKPSVSGTAPITILLESVIEAKPGPKKRVRRSKREKTSRARQITNSPAVGELNALAGANSASAAAVGDVDGAADVSDASHNSSKSGSSASSDDDCPCEDDVACGVEEGESAPDSDSNRLWTSKPTEAGVEGKPARQTVRRTSFSDVAARPLGSAATPAQPKSVPKRSAVSESPLVKDETNFPSLGAVVSRQKESPTHTPRSAVIL